MNAAGAERELAGIAGQDVEPERREREDQERNQDRRRPIRRCRPAGSTTKAISSMTTSRDAVLPDREDRLIRGVAWS